MDHTCDVAVIIDRVLRHECQNYCLLCVRLEYTSGPLELEYTFITVNVKLK